MPLKLARLLAVLVALVVPLQGMALVAAGQCMALGHHQGTGDAHEHDAHSHADGGKYPQDGEMNSHCGPCTACCAPASMAPPAVVSIIPAATLTQYAFSQFPPVGMEPDGVYRPPLPL